MRKKGILILISIAIVIKFSCQNDLKEKIIMDKKFQDHRINFVLVSRDFDTFNLLQRGKDDDLILKLIDSLNNDLNPLSRSLEYESYYNLYSHSLSYDDKKELDRKSAIHQLKSIKEKILNNDLNVDLSQLNNYYLYYRYSSLFNESWFMNPTLGFSEEFYQNLLSDQTRELLFNGYQYEADSNSSYFIPRVLQLQTSDIYTIQPHYITPTIAKGISNDIERSTIMQSQLLAKEVEMIKSILQKVVSGNSKLIIYNYD